MKARAIILTFSFVFLPSLGFGSHLNAEETLVADYIQHEMKVVKLLSIKPLDVTHVAKAQEEFTELVIASGNKPLQLAYVKQSITGVLEMVPLEPQGLLLERVTGEIEELANGDADSDLATYTRLRAQLAFVYAIEFKKHHDVTFSPKIEEMLAEIRD